MEPSAGSPSEYHQSTFLLITRQKHKMTFKLITSQTKWSHPLRVTKSKQSYSKKKAILASFYRANLTQVDMCNTATILNQSLKQKISRYARTEKKRELNGRKAQEKMI